MSARWVVLVVVLLVWVVVVVGGVLLGRRLQARWFSGTGLSEWRAEARTLSWRDRWTVMWAVFRGRAAPRRLAPFAVRRATMARAVSERVLAKHSVQRRLWKVFAGVGAVLVVLDVVVLATGDRRWNSWLDLGIAVMWLGLALGMTRLHRHEARKADRSLRLNRAQLDADDPGGTGDAPPRAG